VPNQLVRRREVRRLQPGLGHPMLEGRRTGEFEEILSPSTMCVDKPCGPNQAAKQEGRPRRNARALTDQPKPPDGNAVTSCPIMFIAHVAFSRQDARKRVSPVDISVAGPVGWGDRETSEPSRVEAGASLPPSRDASPRFG
jgi:hypothetical protein